MGTDKDPELMAKKIKTRVNEIKELINEMQKPDFLIRVGFKPKTKFSLDMDKLCVGGHSMGACTAFTAS